LDPDAPHAARLYPAVVFLAVASLAVWTWQAQRRQELLDVEEDTELVTPGIATRFRMMLGEEIRPVRRVARELDRQLDTGRARFHRMAESARSASPSLREIAWVNNDGTVRSVFDPEGESGLVEGQTLQSAPPPWREAFEASRQPPRASVIADRWHDAPVQWVSFMIVGERGDQQTHGAVVARLNVVGQAEAVFEDGTRDSFDILVHDDKGRVAYTTGQRRGTSRVRTERPLDVHGARWHVHVQPTDEFVAARRRGATPLVLAGGLALASLASLGTAQALLHRRRERLRTTTHLGALEALSRLSKSISERPGAPVDVLVELAGAASRLMNMSMAAVTLYDARARAMRVVHRLALPDPDGRDVYDVGETPCQAEAMRTGRPMLFGDVNAPGSPFRAGHLDRYGARSLILMPMTIAGEPVGVLMLADGRTRAFDELDRQFAELWMAEASALLSNRRLYERMTAALEQRERLYEVHTRVRDATSLRDALGLIAQLAPRALGVDACVVCLAHATPGQVEVAAVTPGASSEELRDDLVVRCATCSSVIEQGSLKHVEDTRDHPVRGFAHMGSALFVPLKSAGATTGLLVLLRAARGALDDEQVRLAELFAARAASAIENARLYEQTRRQAETNATLLRELNHRVGNNFASIIGLLRVAAEQLPPGSCRGLERAAERVHLMSRAHELFSGGSRAVTLGDLVQTTLASVAAAAESADVRVEARLGAAAGVTLSSTLGITLAMVLHELSYNAVRHALADGGELLIGASPPDCCRGKCVCIEVTDRPAVMSVAGADRARADDELDADDKTSLGLGSGLGLGSAHAGVGLQLVRNLVARELRGTFTLARTDSGTTATLQIPLDTEAECQQ
jgi:two-component sensor histidine kinase